MPAASAPAAADRTPLTAAEFAALMRPLGPFGAAPRLAAGVSGGPDSLAMALLAADWTKTRGGDLLALVKPQFELQPDQIGKGGIVRDAGLFQDVETRIRSCCRAWPMKVHAYFQSPITGGNGNTEFFVWARHPESARPDPAPKA
jgi:hypothetical protein